MITNYVFLHKERNIHIHIYKVSLKLEFKTLILPSLKILLRTILLNYNCFKYPGIKQSKSPFINQEFFSVMYLIVA